MIIMVIILQIFLLACDLSKRITGPKIPQRLLRKKGKHLLGRKVVSDNAQKRTSYANSRLFVNNFSRVLQNI